MECVPDIIIIHSKYFCQCRVQQGKGLPRHVSLRRYEKIDVKALH